MGKSLRVLWTILAQDTPHPLRHCSRCDGERPFRTSGRFRLNANGRRIDAWLIYRCKVCDGTWNRPLLERRPLAGVAPALLDALRRNDPDLASRVAFDIAALRRQCRDVAQTSDTTVHKVVVSRPTGAVQRLEIRLAVPQATALRLDRLLSRELGLSRSRLQALCADRRLVMVPEGPRALRRTLRDGGGVILDLSREADAAALAAAAGAAQ